MVVADEIEASLESSDPISLQTNKISAMLPTLNPMIFGRNILTIEIKDQPGYEITVVRSSVESIEIVPTVHNNFVFQFSF